MSVEAEDVIVIEPPGTHGDASVPIVFLFGWIGCRDRYLAKYSAIYEAQKCITVRYTACCALHKIKSQDGFGASAMHVYKAVDNLLHTTEHPIIFHVFSMNGCSLFASLWELLDTVNDGQMIKNRVKGLVFDSCPAYTRPWQSSRALAFAALPPPLHSNFARFSYRCFYAAFYVARRTMLWLQSWWDPTAAFDKHSAYYRMMQFNDLPKNQLYLCSKTDEICAHKSITEFCDSQLHRGASIETKCWPESSHCEHLRKYPEDYTAATVAFLHKMF
uniref:Transmembrane protein 53 n=1 Tax=Plectus sambesii TaxID=2011161 RepID=A0A914XEX3_9BILA